MTEKKTGMTEKEAGTTEEEAGMPQEAGMPEKEPGMAGKAAETTHSSPECQLRIPYPSAIRAGSLALTSWVMTRLA